MEWRRDESGEKMNKRLCLAEAAVIVCLLVTNILSWNVAGGGTRTDSSKAYWEPDFSQTVWTEEKKLFAEKNSQYLEREALFMRFGIGPVDLCCIGDSITQKFEWQDIFSGWRVANRGIGSDTTDGALARLDSIIKLSPAVISCMLGINDISIGRTTDEIVTSYQEILHIIHDELPQTRIIVTSVLPVTEAHSIDNAEVRALNRALEGICELEYVNYLDVYSLFANENGNLKEEYALDNVHLNSIGYSQWLSALVPVVEQELIAN